LPNGSCTAEAFCGTTMRHISSWPGEQNLHKKSDTLTLTFLLRTHFLAGTIGLYVDYVRGSERSIVAAVRVILRGPIVGHTYNRLKLPLQRESGRGARRTYAVTPSRRRCSLARVSCFRQQTWLFEEALNCPIEAALSTIASHLRHMRSTWQSWKW